MRLFVDFEIIDHGAEHEQYFQGAGVTFTRYSDIVTGAGSTPEEALEDALDQVMSVIPETVDASGLIQEAGDTAIAWRERPSEIPGEMGEDGWEPNPDFYHYVSIRWRYESLD